MNSIKFTQPDLFDTLQTLDVAALDELPFSLIGFDTEGKIQIYNAGEAQASGFDRQRMIGANLFSEIAICMNNYLVAQRFDDCLEQGLALDDSLDYILTFRMKPTKVKLRLLAKPAHGMRYVAIERRI